MLAVITIIIGICYLCDEPVLSWVSDRIFRGRHIANVLRIIALAAQFREPLADVLHRLAMTYPARQIRRRLDLAASHVNAGASWQDALRGATLITQAEQSLLNTAEKAGNLPWALREVASRREKLAVYWIATRLQVLYPFIILALGLFVAFYAIALFIPIVSLINGLSK
jgi:type II secretory pathway component PulF